MEQQYPRSPWYDQSLSGQGQTGPDRRQQGKKPGRKPRTGWKVAGIALSVLVLIAASVLAFGGEPADPWRIPSAPKHSADPGQLPDSDGYFDDFRDFFSSYYQPVSTPAPDSQLARTEADTDFRLHLQPAGDLPELSLQELYAACADAVVGIRATGTSTQLGGYFWGSGFLVSADGYILTNQHIISGTRTATVVLADGREFPALLVGEDARTDIAVLKIDAAGLPFLELGESDALAVGDRVAAIGNPLGIDLSGTLTDGIISAIDRSISYNGNTLTLLQTNAALNEGNSGGPLFNLQGQVVGITNMKMSAAVAEVSIEGIGFAIPSSTLKSVTDQLLAKGSVSRPGLGLTLGAVPEDVAAHYDLPEGLYVSAVAEGSSAMEEGVRVGDIVTRVNGQPVHSTEEVLEIRDSLAVGDRMVLTLYREGRQLEVTIQLRELGQLTYNDD